jgi:DNA replication protein DnaC
MTSPHWNNNQSPAEIIDTLRKQRREAQNVGDVLTEWLETTGKEIEQRIDTSPKREPMPELTEAEKIVQMKRDFHRAASMMVQQYGYEQYTYTDENKSILNLLIRFFLNLTTEIPVRKGVMLIGEPGCGKSLIMETFSRILKNENSFSFYPAISICNEREALKNEEAIRDFFNRYGRRITRDGGGLNHVCIDDLFKEETERAYSYGKNPLKQILNDRNNLIRFGVKTHATANYTLAEMRETYGPALVDRLRQMFFVIELNQPSFRR